MGVEPTEPRSMANPKVGYLLLIARKFVSIVLPRAPVEVKAPLTSVSEPDWWVNLATLSVAQYQLPKSV